MSETAIHVRNLGKRYRIGGGQESYGTLRDAISLAAMAPLSWLKNRNERLKEFWALRDVSFEVKPGEVLGIIGRNGAGKSTLLKILSRVTYPTEGQADIWGRVGSLLEVGTGFHPELSGRENIFLNGAVLGMKKAEIQRKFAEIVEFAEVEQFLDTPVKRYSSGMYMRLAFAVAAHLEPEILIVDEVLAVGDSAFQKKCLGKLSAVSREGRTVLLVSHNMAAIRTLCSSVIVLDRGRLTWMGDTSQCVKFYEEQNTDLSESSWKRSSQAGQRGLLITQVNSRLHGEQPHLVLELDIFLESNSRHKAAFLAVDILDSTGVALMQAIPQLESYITDTKSRHCIPVEVELPPLIPGRYLVTVWVGSHNTETIDEVQEVIAFDVFDSPTKGRTYPHTIEHGYIVPRSSIKSY